MNLSRLFLRSPLLRLLRKFSAPAPTYLVGIDEAREVGYILAILHGMAERISSIPTDYPLDCTTLPVLYQEVERFWAGRDMARRHSAFSGQGTP